MRKQLPAWAALGIIIIISIGLLFLANQFIVPADSQSADGNANGTENEGASQGGAVLTASEGGFGGDVTVNVTLAEDGSIAKVDIDAPGETAGIGSRVIDEAAFAEQFIGKTSTEGVDALSGATISSEAVIKAVDKALASAGDQPAGAADAGSGAVLTASEGGFGGDVTVNVTLADDGSIAKVDIEAPGETAGIGSRVIDEAAFAEQFIGKTSTEGVDALSGATISSEAVIKAVDKALASK